MRASVGSRPRSPGPMRPFEPSTDFPTTEDEVPCPHRARWAVVAIATAVGLVLGLLAGFWLGRGTAFLALG